MFVCFIVGFTDVSQIIEITTTVISTCSLGHAAANFQQYDQYAFVPNYPGILMEPPPTTKVRHLLPSFTMLGLHLYRYHVRIVLFEILYSSFSPRWFSILSLNILYTSYVLYYFNVVFIHIQTIFKLLSG